MMRLLVLMAVAVATVDCTLDIITPAEFVRNVTAVRFNNFLGPKLESANIPNASVVWWRGEDPPRRITDTDDCNSYDGAVVVVDSLAVQWLQHEEERAVLAFQNCGAVAIIRVLSPSFGSRGRVGLHINTRDEDCCRGHHNIIIPVLEAFPDDLIDLRDAIWSGTDIRANLFTIDPNLWVQDFHHATIFVILFRVFLPISNAFIAGAAIHTGIQRHRMQMVRRRKKWTSLDAERPWYQRIPMPLVQVGLITEAFACSLRAFYCAIGPVLMTSFFTYTGHVMTGNLSVPLQIITIAVTLVMFQRVGVLRKREGKYNNRMLVAFCVIILAAELITGYLRSTRNYIGSSIAISALVSALIIGVASIVFITFGYKFLSRLASNVKYARADNAESPKERARRTFTRWIMIGSGIQMLEVMSGLLPVAMENFFYSPRGFGVVYGLYYTGFTFASWCHVVAFMPRRTMDSDRRNTIAGSVLGLTRKVSSVWFGKSTKSSKLAKEFSLPKVTEMDKYSPDLPQRKQRTNNSHARDLEAPVAIVAVSVKRASQDTNPAPETKRGSMSFLKRNSRNGSGAATTFAMAQWHKSDSNDEPSRRPEPMAQIADTDTVRETVGDRNSRDSGMSSTCQSRDHSISQQLGVSSPVSQMLQVNDPRLATIGHTTTIDMDSHNNNNLHTDTHMAHPVVYNTIDILCDEDGGGFRSDEEGDMEMGDVTASPQNSMQKYHSASSANFDFGSPLPVGAPKIYAKTPNMNSMSENNMSLHSVNSIESIKVSHAGGARWHPPIKSRGSDPITGHRPHPLPHRGSDPSTTSHRTSKSFLRRGHTHKRVSHSNSRTQSGISRGGSFNHKKAGGSSASLLSVMNPMRKKGFHIPKRELEVVPADQVVM